MKFSLKLRKNENHCLAKKCGGGGAPMLQVHKYKLIILEERNLVLSVFSLAKDSLLILACAQRIWTKKGLRCWAKIVDFNIRGNVHIKVNITCLKHELWFWLTKLTCCCGCRRLLCFRVILSNCWNNICVYFVIILNFL